MRFSPSACSRRSTGIQGHTRRNGITGRGRNYEHVRGPRRHLRPSTASRHPPPPSIRCFRSLRLSDLCDAMCQIGRHILNAQITRCHVTRILVDPLQPRQDVRVECLFQVSFFRPPGLSSGVARPHPMQGGLLLSCLAPAKTPAASTVPGIRRSVSGRQCMQIASPANSFPVRACRLSLGVVVIHPVV